MITQYTVVLIYSGYALLPGYLLTKVAGLNRNRFLLSYGLSVSLLILTLAFALQITNNISQWFVPIHTVMVGTGLLLARIYKIRINKTSSRRFRPLRLKQLANLGSVVLLLLFGVYHLIVGPYTEIPSDYWKHLARIGISSSRIVDGSLGETTHFGFIQDETSVVYLFHALVANFVDTNPIGITSPATFVTGGLFLLSIYWFSFDILNRFDVNTRVRIGGALLATILTFLTFGTASFSYVRYYAFFPTIVAFPMIYACAAILQDYFERPKNSSGQILLIPIFIVTMWQIHRQEALLGLLLLAVITVVRLCRTCFSTTTIPNTLRNRVGHFSFILLFLFVLSVLYAIIAKSINPWTQTPHVVDMGSIFSPLRGIPIDNPSFRFWDTLGYFGLGVYFWAVVRWKVIAKSDFLSAGMLMPAFTNLNPFYAILFLHFGSATNLWRTAYLMPLGIVAAVLFIVSCSSKHLTKSFYKLFISFVFSLYLVVSIVPWNFMGTMNRTSRLPSLMPVHAASGAHLWGDAINAIDRIQNEQKIRRILTDSVTRFVLYAATRGEIWWWPKGEYFPKHIDDYKEDFLNSDFSKTLLVINKRNGATTDSARYSGHWPPNILKVSQQYPEDLEAFISSHPKHFSLLWGSKDIKIFLMQNNHK